MTEEMTEAHEWQCLQCGFYYRLEFAPLVIDGAECSKCKSKVQYNGIVVVPRSRVGVRDTAPGTPRPKR